MRKSRGREHKLEVSMPELIKSNSAMSNAPSSPAQLPSKPSYRNYKDKEFVSEDDDLMVFRKSNESLEGDQNFIIQEQAVP
jgi:hypothetical protein